MGTREKYGPTALVTGAAAGIGAAFADLLADAGLGLVLVDRDEAGLSAKAESLRARGARVRTFALDLADPAALAPLLALAETDEVGLLVHSAGFQKMGPALELPLEPQLLAIDLHCRTSLALAHTFGRAMRVRGRGGIVLLSSNSAILASPWLANYAATKAYTLTLACALWEELRDEGVDVLALVPGMTDTPGLSGSDPNARARSITQPASVVAASAMKALGKGPVHLTSLPDRLAAGFFGRLLPRAWALPLARRSLEQFYPRLRRR